MDTNRPGLWGGGSVSLRELPLAWRGLITCVLIFLLAGYFAALLNVLAQNELVDGQPGLSARDLVLKYHGGYVSVQAGRAAPSRMLEMIQGAMRQYFQSDSEYQVVHSWLAGGADEASFDRGPPPTPHDVILTTCLRCHAASGGKEIGTRSPFGPDLFTVDYAMVAKFALPAEPGQSVVWRPPRVWRELAMTTHAHMLSVPIFVVLLGALFLWSGWPEQGAGRSAGDGHGRWRAALRTGLACAPLVFFLIDVSCWWLARLPGVGPAFALLIGVSGLLFGIAYVTQWTVVMAALWTRPSTVKIRSQPFAPGSGT